MSILEQVRQSRALGAQSGVQQGFHPSGTDASALHILPPAFLPPWPLTQQQQQPFIPGQNNRYPSSQASHPLIPSVIPSRCSPAQPQL